MSGKKGNKYTENQGDRKECNLFRRLEMGHDVVYCMCAQSQVWRALEWSAEGALAILK